MRLIFAGTPAAALPSLDAVAASGHDLVAVLTRPDARAGRGRTLVASPVAQRAEELGVPVIRTTRPNDPEVLAAVTELAPDCCPIVAYGGLIRPPLLSLPEHGWVNLHFSLLPAWRGAAPVQWAIIAGDELTGASTFALEEGLDTGPVYGLLTEPIEATDTAGDLLDRLAVAGARLLLDTLDGIEADAVHARPQAGEGISLAPRLHTDDARVDWTRPAAAIDRRIRGCTPAPGAWCLDGEARLGIGPVRSPTSGPAAQQSAPEPTAELAPGEVAVGRDAVLVGTASGPVTLGEVRPAGRTAMPATDWARGARLRPGHRLT